jgi:HK97 family phage major capsid protein
MLVFPTDDGDPIEASWAGERQSKSVTNTGTVGLLKIPTHIVYMQPKVSNVMLKDNQFDVVAYISNKNDLGFAIAEGNKFTSGNGVTAPRGFLTYSAWTTAGTYQRDAIEQVASGTAGQFTATGIMRLQNSLNQVYQSNARFLLKRTSMLDVMTLTYGDGHYIFNMNLLNAGLPMSILGQPLDFCDAMPAVAGNALAMAYGDFYQGYAVVDTAGVNVIRDQFTSKGDVIFYTEKMVGGAVQNSEAIKLLKLAASL